MREGNRERLQAFEGVVIGKRNRGLNSAFTLRKMSHGVGVERTFQTHSPLIASIVVKRRGDVRKAKLYYLRERSGRAARIKEKVGAAVRSSKGPKPDGGAQAPVETGTRRYCELLRIQDGRRGGPRISLDHFPRNGARPIFVGSSLPSPDPAVLSRRFWLNMARP